MSSERIDWLEETTSGNISRVTAPPFPGYVVPTTTEGNLVNELTRRRIPFTETEDGYRAISDTSNEGHPQLIDTYDRQGRIISMLIRNELGLDCDTRVDYTFDAKGRVCRVQDFTIHGKVKSLYSDFSFEYPDDQPDENYTLVVNCVPGPVNRGERFDHVRRKYEAGKNISAYVKSGVRWAYLAGC